MFLNLHLLAQPPLPSSSLISQLFSQPPIFISQPFSRPPITAPHLHLSSLNLSHSPPSTSSSSSLISLNLSLRL
jgi:hypothetical protein